MSWTPTEHPPIERMTVPEFRRQIFSGRIVTGDGVLYHYGAPAFSRRLIGRVQRRILPNLCEAKGVGSEGGRVAAENAGWTHAGMVLSPWFTVEQTTPRCRTALWVDVIRPGDRLLVVRPALVGAQSCEDRRELLEAASRAALQDVEQRVPYPHRELLIYWLWSWGIRRTLWGHSFLDIFSAETGNVCSSSVIGWWRSAGLLANLTGCDARPEAWYPGRMGCDPALRAVAHIEIIADEPEQPTQGD